VGLKTMQGAGLKVHGESKKLHREPGEVAEINEWS